MKKQIFKFIGAAIIGALATVVAFFAWIYSQYAEFPFIFIQVGIS